MKQHLCFFSSSQVAAVLHPLPAPAALAGHGEEDLEDAVVPEHQKDMSSK